MTCVIQWVSAILSWRRSEYYWSKQWVVNPRFFFFQNQLYSRDLHTGGTTWIGFLVPTWLSGFFPGISLRGFPPTSKKTLKLLHCLLTIGFLTSTVMKFTFLRVHGFTTRVNEWNEMKPINGGVYLPFTCWDYVGWCVGLKLWISFIEEENQLFNHTPDIVCINQGKTKLHGTPEINEISTINRYIIDTNLVRFVVAPCINLFWVVARINSGRQFSSSIRMLWSSSGGCSTLLLAAD